MATRHNFRNAARVAQIENNLESYMTWAIAENVRSAAVQARIHFECGFLELRGEIGRVDVTTSGYRAIILRTPLAGWQNELRMPLLQEAVSATYGRPAGEIEVGFQKLDSTDLQTASYDAGQLREAQNRFRILGRTIRNLSQTRS
jgi:hypothetical protein